MRTRSAPAPTVGDTTVDLLVVGAGTGMAAALTANELGLSTLIIEKTEYVGGSTARSGGAFWLPDNPILRQAGAGDSQERAEIYLRAVVGDSAPAERGKAFVDNSAATVEMMQRLTPMKFFWAEGYSDYHPELPGGSAIGRTCECRPFNASVLRAERRRLRPGLMEAPVPMPTTGADYKWMNLVARVPSKGVPRILKRLAQGVGGLALRREYMAGGQALAAGLLAGVVRAGIPVWTETSLVRLITEGDRVTGAVVAHDGREVTVTARRGVVLAAGGFDHDMAMRHKYQSERLGEHESLGAEGNTGDAIRVAQETGATTGLMDQAWWFPAVAALPGGAPTVMLAERSLPGSFIVDQTGRRFINESIDYMSYGQRILERERAGDPVESAWIVFDQKYRNSYIFAAGLFPRQPLPQAWYEAGIAHKADDPAELARKIGVPEHTFAETFRRFNEDAMTGTDSEFQRGQSAYDRYYGDPTIQPNPNLRPLTSGPFYAVKTTLSDLGTCGGVLADERARVLREDGSAIEGLYAIGNTAANVFGRTYPGAGATIGQGLVFGYIAARDAAGQS
ncbi:3-ketosteroid-delta-1-dehydrogenase [Nocardia cyriacigeorgica]|uniref:3-ketosteroid-delta-1-dehydrogenase n=1 Tax=Nocardia cyriacigeorgica TaxID=135487 RepID=UPI0018956E51|nr:3-ketosteroid-delta-1-dehydrogenase [Nocardia cyriacigeorgica]MBF6455121.1 3-ketosteroid-delta-1-dehydrogenase [Nocardia cyriacigeorgica]MBF6478876.1 3-ketosteroid-delta-1-dehydrogenase [Nocardia cyriacigeorgica]MBF6553016.1 3-ketosteroid-delta-1-dehydrogenase [Nocardia cyriacigeorgica]